MANSEAKTVTCQICKQTVNLSDAFPGSMIREALAEEIRKQHPEWSPASYICRSDLDVFRADYVQHALEAEKGELSALETEVVKAMSEQELLAKNLNTEFDSQLTFGQRIADHVAEFGGSWKFIISFGIVIGLWISINCVALLQKHFDPFPFILLNLVLSCLAAIQAPVIMMSQNRQEAKDRMRSEHDYQVNLKAELEIRNLGEKMDHLLYQQWQRLMEIQQIQTDLMEELSRKVSGGNSSGQERDLPKPPPEHTAST